MVRNPPLAGRTEENALYETVAIFMAGVMIKIPLDEQTHLARKNYSSAPKARQVGASIFYPASSYFRLFLSSVFLS